MHHGSHGKQVKGINSWRKNFYRRDNSERHLLARCAVTTMILKKSQKKINHLRYVDALSRL